MLTNASVLVGVLAIRVAQPDMVPDIDRLIEEPEKYWVEAYMELAVWAIALLLLSCLLAYLAGAHRLPSRLAATVQSHRIGRWLLPPAQVQFVSAWQLALKDHFPAHYVRGCPSNGVSGDQHQVTPGWFLVNDVVHKAASSRRRSPSPLERPSPFRR